MYSNITLHKVADYDALSNKAADIFSMAVSAAPTRAYGFATGGTPEGMYAEMIKRQQEGTADFSRLVAYNLDEYHPLKPNHDQSYCYFMAKNLFDAVGLPLESRNIPKGDAEKPVEEALAYDAKVLAAKINMQILGIGTNGHIGFNEPADSFRAQTGHVALAESTIKSNARYFESADDVPRHAITMGIGTIMMADAILLLVSGEGKAAILRDSLRGSITPLVPASVLQLHRHVIVVADEAAAKLL